VGAIVGIDAIGNRVGWDDGAQDGPGVVGSAVGAGIGDAVGYEVDGVSVGELVVGWAVGAVLGVSVGDSVGVHRCMLTNQYGQRWQNDSASSMYTPSWHSRVLLNAAT